MSTNALNDLNGRRDDDGKFGPRKLAEPAFSLSPAPPSLQALIGDFTASDPRLDIWRRYPEISWEEDESTDYWACEQVSAEFAEYARARGVDAQVFTATAHHEWADLHAWVCITSGDTVTAVDWTARQYHNLHEEGGRDPKVLAAPWPLVWDQSRAGNEHPFMGPYTNGDQPHTCKV